MPVISVSHEVTRFPTKNLPRHQRALRMRGNRCARSHDLRPRPHTRATMQVCVDPTRPVSQRATLITGSRRVTILSR